MYAAGNAMILHVSKSRPRRSIIFNGQLDVQKWIHVTALRSVALKYEEKVAIFQNGGQRQPKEI